MPDAPAPTTTWPPDTKFIAGGIGAIVSWGLVYGAGYFGLNIPPEVQTAIPGLVAMALVYLVPPSMYDIVKRVNNIVVAAAARDPNNPTRAIVIPTTAPMGTEAAAQSAVHKEIAVAGVGLPP